MSYSVKRNLWVVLAVVILLGAAALIAAAAGGLLSPGMPDVPDAEFEYEKASAAQVDDPGISLNGADYPALPVLQDFIDRDWVPNGVAEVIGDYSEPDATRQLESGVIYTYFEPGNGVSEVSFSFKGTDTPAIQIMVVFGDNR